MMIKINFYIVVPVNLNECLNSSISDSSLRITRGSHYSRNEFAHCQLTSSVSIESVLEQQQNLLPHTAVLVTKARTDLLEELLWGHGRIHQLAEDNVGLLPDLHPGVAQPVQDGGQNGVEVWLEL